MPEELGRRAARALAPDRPALRRRRRVRARARGAPSPRTGRPPAARTAPPPAHGHRPAGPCGPTVPVPPRNGGGGSSGPPWPRPPSPPSPSRAVCCSSSGGRRPWTVFTTSRARSEWRCRGLVGQLQDWGWPLDRFGLPGGARRLSPYGRRHRALARRALGRARTVRRRRPRASSPSTVLATAAHRTCGTAVDRQVRSGELSGPARRSRAALGRQRGLGRRWRCRHGRCLQPGLPAGPRSPTGQLDHTERILASLS
jgi:hypothetical protein